MSTGDPKFYYNDTGTVKRREPGEVIGWNTWYEQGFAIDTCRHVGVEMPPGFPAMRLVFEPIYAEQELTLKLIKCNYCQVRQPEGGLCKCCGAVLP